MRPIKFRAWDKFKKRMVEPRLILAIHFDRRNQEPNLVTYLEKYMNPTREISDFDKVFCNEFDLIQYTGLKDKNGVEIFEGDIVTYIDKHGQRKIGKINYANAKYYIGNFETLGYASERYELEVIGDIYQNSELLEEAE